MTTCGIKHSSDSGREGKSLIKFEKQLKYVAKVIQKRTEEVDAKEYLAGFFFFNLST